MCRYDIRVQFTQGWWYNEWNILFCLVLLILKGISNSVCDLKMYVLGENNEFIVRVAVLYHFKIFPRIFLLQVGSISINSFVCVLCFVSGLKQKQLLFFSVVSIFFFFFFFNFWLSTFRLYIKLKAELRNYFCLRRKANLAPFLNDFIAKDSLL